MRRMVRGGPEMHRYKLANDKGSVLLIGVVLAMLLTLVGLAMFDLSLVESNLAVNQIQTSQALRIAEAGVYKALRELSSNNADAKNLDFSTIYAANKTNFAYFTANTKLPDSGASNEPGAYTVTTTSCKTVSNDPLCSQAPAATAIVITSSGCYPTPTYGSPSCPNPPTDAPAGVTRKTIKT